ncbi:MAG: phosphoribosyl-AMP cyclohydrolase [Micavibrio sp. TMED27]|nr:phosphoribosyl-AMP cyclohydrolase [Micavibrio sp.]OUT92119.1 MAG: phosphoribosyl-AMP cyclohydrolase [Micavibrio sp. TMED27]|tara:strand:+ start:964 stop:1380 length:417 start_codon:yes stop_codon:yes gene_type:complete
MDKHELETTTNLSPKFDNNGLIPCITTSAKTGKVLMFAYMNQQAIDKTLETKEVHYWSRSRSSLWHKGASSGMVQKLVEMRIDCDQDCIWVTVEMQPEASCHTGRQSCFYRKLERSDNGTITMSYIDDELIFDPKDVY